MAQRHELAKQRAEQQKQKEKEEKEKKLREKEERAAAAKAEAEAAKKAEAEKAKRAKEEAAAAKVRAEAAAKEEAEKAKRAKEQAEKAKADELRAQQKAEYEEKRKREEEARSEAKKAKKDKGPLPPGWKEYKDAKTGRSYYVFNGGRPENGGITTWTRPIEQPAAASSSAVHIPEDKPTTDDDGSDADSPPQQRSAYPAWTAPAQLQPALAQQVNTDGDAIFDQPIHQQAQAIDLGQIFQGRGRNRQRTSSACWNRPDSNGHVDALTAEEEAAFKDTMGYFPPSKQL